MNKILTLVFGLSVLLSPLSVSAQVVGFGEEVPKAPEGSIACTDHYQFGSVATAFAPSVNEVIAGIPLTFTGSVKNNNPYPVVNGKVFVRVFQLNDTWFQAGDGHGIVDEFMLPETYTLKAGGDKSVMFDWTSSQYLPSGAYQAAFYFITEERFNLEGLPFSEDVSGARVDFSVKNLDQKQVTYFDKGKTTLNDEDYFAIGTTPILGANDVVTIKTTLTNPTNEKRTASLFWKEYTWDAISSDNLKTQIPSVLELAPGESREVSYTVQPSEKAVSYVTAETKDFDTKSIIAVRFARDNSTEIRLNFPTIIKYPLKANQENAVFTCAHATTLANVEDTKITLTLKDKAGAVIHSYVYSGSLSSTMSGFKETFTPKKDYANFTLEATLERGGERVETYSIEYNCKDIDTALCEEGGFGSMDDGKKLGILLVIVLSLIALGAILWSKAKKSPKRFSAFLLAFLLSLTFFGMSASQAEAKSITASGWLPLYAIPLNSNGHVNTNDVEVTHSVTYTFNLLDADTLAPIADGSPVPVGTRILMQEKAKPANVFTTDISWTYTGAVSGTPNGKWTPSPDYCAMSHNIGTGYSDVPEWRNFTGFVNYRVQPPVVTTNSTGSTAAVASLGGNIFRVDSNGPVVLNADHAPTSGSIRVLRQAGGYPCAPVASLPIAVPARTITFNLTGTGGNNDPAKPSLTGPVSGNTNTPYGFNSTATDPDNNPIRYRMDWDNDGTFDQEMPSSGFVSSGTLQTFTYPGWLTPGTYPMRVQAIDNQGGVSPWSDIHSITIVPVVVGLCGAAHAIPTTPPPTIGLCNSGSPTAVTPGVAPGPYAWSCTGSGGGADAACSAPYLPPAPTFNFSINGVPAPGSTTINRGGNLNLQWNSVTNATGCNASSTDGTFTGAKGIIFPESQNIVANTSTVSFTLTCTGPGGSLGKTVTVTLDNTFKLCENSCSSGIEPPASFTMTTGSSKTLKACLNDAISCTDGSGDVTGNPSTTWTDGGTLPVTIGGGIINAITAGTEGITATNSTGPGYSQSRTINVICLDPGVCSTPGNQTEALKYCTNENFNVVDACGVSVNCPGVKSCDFNWKEVAP